MRLIENTLLTNGLLDNYVTLESSVSGKLKVSQRPFINSVFSLVTQDYKYTFSDASLFTGLLYSQTVLFDEISLVDQLIPDSTTSEDADLINLATYLGLDIRTATNDEILTAIDVLQTPCSLINNVDLFIFLKEDIDTLCLALVERQNTNEINEGTIIQTDINSDDRIPQLHLGKREWRALLDEIDTSSNGQDDRVIKHVISNYPWNASALTQFNSGLSNVTSGK
jgi:hypothetical protein